MDIAWEVEDGYIGKSIPQRSTINDSEIRKCKDSVEARQLIEETIDMDFAGKINWGFLSFDSVVKDVHKILAIKKQSLPFG